MIKAESVFSVAERCEFTNCPLLIAGAGPSWDVFSWDKLSCEFTNIFALNHTITELWSRPGVFWVSNDHDRTFQSKHVSQVVPPRLADYSPWKTITQKQFVPGEIGDFRWIDHKGKRQEPLTWRLPAPEGSTIYYYVAGEYMNGHPEWVHNGESVLELALEIATLWQFSPIVLVGCDMTMTCPEEYYANPFRYKDTPRRIVRGKLNTARSSVVKNRDRWLPEIHILTDLWVDPPFLKVKPLQALRILQGEGAWSRH